MMKDLRAARPSPRGGGAIVLAFACLTATAGDWPAYRGPAGNGICPERIATEWPADGPPLLWRRPLTEGFGSMSVADGRLFTLVLGEDAGGPRELCVAFDAVTGDPLWSADVGPGGGYQSGPEAEAGGSDGPRSTPVWHAGRVYVLATYLQLSCLEAATGEVVWSTHLRNDLEAYTIPWHSAASPVIADGVLLVSTGRAGRAMVGLNPADGAVLWRSGSGNYTHATPVPVNLAGRSQVIFATWEGLLALDPATGAEVWRHPLAFNHTSVGASPVVVGDLVYCSAAYGTGAAAARISGSGPAWQATPVWRKVSARLMNHWMTPVAHAGHVYGFYGQHKYTTAPLQCVDVETGEVLWGEDGFGHGGLLLVGDLLLAATDRGDLVLADASPEAYHERARFRAIRNGVVWNVPAISNGRLYVRGTRELAAFDVSLPLPPPLRLGARLAEHGGIRIEVRSEGPDAIPADRAERVEAVTSLRPELPLADWEPVGIEWTWDSGSLWGELPVEAAVGRRFFRVIEQ